MKQLTRFTISPVRFGLLLLCTVALALSGCNASSTSSARSSSAANPQGSPLYTLDVVLLGPFAVLDCSNGKGIRVLVPEVEDHKPLGIGYPFDSGQEPEKYRELTRGDYGLLGIPGSATPNVVNPVQDTEALTFPASEVCPAMGACAYVCIDLPRPKEFVPWNADRAQVSRRGGNQGQWRRLATALVLRYPDTDLNGIKLSRKDAGKPCGAAPCELKPKRNATEGILALVLEPRKEDTDHSHAQKAFQELMTLVSVQAKITFPTSADDPKHRNQPLTQGVVPPELIESLKQMQRVRIQVRENDCLSPMVLVN